MRCRSRVPSGVYLGIPLRVVGSGESVLDASGKVKHGRRPDVPAAGGAAQASHCHQGAPTKRTAAERPVTRGVPSRPSPDDDMRPERAAGRGRCGCVAASRDCCWPVRERAQLGDIAGILTYVRVCACHRRRSHSSSRAARKGGFGRAERVRRSPSCLLASRTHPSCPEEHLATTSGSTLQRPVRSRIIALARRAIDRGAELGRGVALAFELTLHFT